MVPAELPLIDRHETVVDAPADRVWSVLPTVLPTTGSLPVRLYLGLVRAEPGVAVGVVPDEGATVPGFRVVEALRYRRLRLEGRHGFARYGLTFTLADAPVGSTMLGVETRAVFPGLRGRLYRLAVVGSGAHRLVMPAVLRVLRRRAERSTAPDRRVVTYERVVAAAPDTIFELIADPSEQPRWDGHDNLGSASVGQRVRAVGDVFATTLTHGSVRENHVTEFEESRRIAWCPADVGARPAGHLWRWELLPVDAGRTLVRHTYDWTALDDAARVARARATTSETLGASVDRLAALVEPA